MCNSDNAVLLLSLRHAIFSANLYEQILIDVIILCVNQVS